jgi:hypothetical protein
MRWQIRGIALAALAFWVAPAAAQTVADALAVVPQDALGFALINKLSEADEKLQELGKQLSIKPIQKSIYREVKQQFGLERGINDQGALLVVLLSPTSGSADQSPPVAFYVPTSNYSQLLQELQARPVKGSKGIASFTPSKTGETMLLGQRGAFAVLMPKENEKELARLLQDPGGGADNLKSLENWLRLNQLSLMLTPKGVQWVSEKLLKEIDSLEKSGIPGGTPELEDLFSAFFKAMHSVVRALKSDLQGAGLGIRLDIAGNLRLTGRALLAPGSELSRLAAEMRVPPGGLLANLPARPFALAFGAALPPRFMEYVMKFSNTLQSLGTKDLPEDLQKRLRETSQQASKDVDSVALMLAVPRKGEALLSSFISLARAKDALALLRATGNYSKLQGEVLDEFLKKNGAGIQIPVIVKNHKLPQGPAVETIYDLSAVASMVPPQVTDIFQTLFGSADKLRITAVALDKHTVISVIAGPNKVKSVLTGEESQKELPGTAGVAKLLPQDPQIVAYLSPHGIMALVQQVLDALPLPMAVPLPEMPRTPPIGIAVRFTAERVEGELLVPAATLTGLGRFIREVMEMIKKQ